MRRPPNDDVTTVAGALVGTIAAILAGALLSPLIGDQSQAIAALVLVVCVLAGAAIGGRFAGIYSAAAAALTFNFFFTQPYHSLRIHSSRDVITTALLFVVGIVAGELALARERRNREAARARVLSLALTRQAEVVAAGTTVEEAWRITRDNLMLGLPLASCRYEPFGTEAPPLPRITTSALLAGRHRLTYIGDGFALPEEGAELAVRCGGRMLGRIVLKPDAHVGVPIGVRMYAVAVADLFGIAIAQRNPVAVLA